MTIGTILGVIIVTIILLAILKDLKGFLTLVVAVIVAYFLVTHTNILGWLWGLVVTIFKGILTFSAHLLS